MLQVSLGLAVFPSGNPAVESALSPMPLFLDCDNILLQETPTDKMNAENITLGLRGLRRHCSVDSRSISSVLRRLWVNSNFLVWIGTL